MYKRRLSNGDKPLCKPSDYLRCFVNEMNKTARDMNLTKTQFQNPHGLSNRLSRASSNDVQ